MYPYKAWELLRFKLPAFFMNIWYFRTALWEHRWYDYSGTLKMIYTSIKVMEEPMHKGLEICVSRDKKIAKMQRSMYLLMRFLEDDFDELAEKELGKRSRHPIEFEDMGNGTIRLVDNDTPEEAVHNKKISLRAREIEKEMWKELWIIFEGQDLSSFDTTKDWYDQFDGSNLRSWWD